MFTRCSPCSTWQEDAKTRVGKRPPLLARRLTEFRQKLCCSSYLSGNTDLLTAEGNPTLFMSCYRRSPPSCIRYRKCRSKISLELKTFLFGTTYSLLLLLFLIVREVGSVTDKLRHSQEKRIWVLFFIFLPILGRVYRHLPERA